MGTPASFLAPLSLGMMREMKIGRLSTLIGILCFASVVSLLIYLFFIIFRFVDHDMFMHYFGGSVGHLGQTSSHIHWQASSKESESFIEAEVNLEPQDCQELILGKCFCLKHI